jgi:hypothetical protein
MRRHASYQFTNRAVKGSYRKFEPMVVGLLRGWQRSTEGSRNRLEVGQSKELGVLHRRKVAVSPL